MNVEKLGHQKKILLGITKLKQIAKNIENTHHSNPTTPDPRQGEWASRTYKRDSLSSGSSGSRVSPATTPMSPYNHGNMQKQDSMRLPPLTPSGYNSPMNQKMANMAAAVATRQSSKHLKIV